MNRRLMAALAAGCFLTASCGTQSGDGSETSGDAKQPTTGPQTLRSALRDSPRIDGDDLNVLRPGIVDEFGPKNPANGYEDLPGVSLVVDGTIEGFTDGPSFRFDDTDPLGLDGLVMQVHVIDTFEGTAPESGNVYVLFKNAGTVSAAEEALPQGTVVGLYLEEARIDPDSSEPVVSPDAGRPDGESLWLSGARGLVVALDSDKGVAFPVVGAVKKNANFRSQLPTSG